MHKPTAIILWILCLANGTARVSCASSCEPGAGGPWVDCDALQAPGPAPAKIPQGVSLSAGLSEDDAVAIALWNNRALQADLAALGLARADLVDAGLLRNPTLQLLLPIGYTQFEMLLNLPGEILWQRPRRVAAAKIEVDRVAQGLEQNGLNLVRDVRVAYADLALAQDRVRLAGEAVQLRREIARLNEARLRAGDISELEANASRVDLSTAEEQAARSAHEVALAGSRLRFLLGLEGEEITLKIQPQNVADFSPATAPPFASITVGALTGDAYSHRPDLLGAALAIEAAARKAKWERVRLFAFAELLSIKQGAGLDFSPRPGLLAELPIFHRNKGGVTRADAEVERAGKQYMAVRHQIANEVKDAYVRLQQAREALELYRTQIMPQTEEGVRLARKGYEAGDESYLFVLEAARRWIDARVREAELVNEGRRATAQFDRCLGRKHDARP